MNFSKKVSLVLGLSVALVSSIATTSMADDCAKAEIFKIGSRADMGLNAIGFTCLSDTSWTPSQYYVNTAIGDEALATALTAMSLGKTVWIRTASRTPGSLISIIYMNK